MRARKSQTREVQIQICPRCLSRRVQRVGSLEGDMMGAIGILPPKFQCQDCDWIGALVIMEIIDLYKKEEDKKLKDCTRTK